MRAIPPELRPDETADTALGGSVGVIQPRAGYRFGVDPILLARFAAERPVPVALDLGCGSGVVGFCLLALGGARRIDGVDLQPEMIDRARRGARWNGWGVDRARYLVADLREPPSLAGGGPYPLVVANPPYHPIGAGRASPEWSKALSRTTLAGDLDAWVWCVASVLSKDGALCTILPSARHRELVGHGRAAGLAPCREWPVRPSEHGEIRFVLARFEFSSEDREPDVRPSLILHGPGRRYSLEAERLLGPPGGLRVSP